MRGEGARPATAAAGGREGEVVSKVGQMIQNPQQPPEVAHLSGSEAGPYLRLIDFVYHSTLGLIVIKKKKSSFAPLLTFWHPAA